MDWVSSASKSANVSPGKALRKSDCEFGVSGDGGLAQIAETVRDDRLKRLSVLFLISADY
jgi:hypothetical protein